MTLISTRHCGHRSGSTSRIRRNRRAQLPLRAPGRSPLRGRSREESPPVFAVIEIHSGANSFGVASDYVISNATYSPKGSRVHLAGQMRLELPPGLG